MSYRAAYLLSNAYNTELRQTLAFKKVQTQAKNTQLRIR